MNAPLVPAVVDLRDFPFMPMEFARLFASDTWTLSNDAEKVAAITLWGKSWSQVPAGSLPDDDRLLAAHSGAGQRWKRLKEMALRGWRNGGDGRLYHPVVCEKALEAWIEKLSQRLSSGAGNAKRWGIEFDPSEIEGQISDALRMLAALNPQSRSLAKRRPPGIPSGSKKTPAGNPTGIPPGIPPGIPSGSQGTGTGTGTGKQDQKQQQASPLGKGEKPARDPEPPPTPTEREPPPVELTVSPAAKACLLMRQAGAVRVNPSHPTLLAGIAEGATPAMYGQAMRDAIDRGKGDPFAYAIATVRAQLAEAKRPPQEPRHAERSPSRKRSVVERVEANIIERREREAAAAEPGATPLATLAR